MPVKKFKKPPETGKLGKKGQVYKNNLLKLDLTSGYRSNRKIV